MHDSIGKLTLERDFSRYNYLSLDSAKVNGVDDAANFRTVRVSKLQSFHYSSKWVTLYCSFGIGNNSVFSDV